uniref:Uncharacterized protein n=1 Tax=Rhipicephalus zambeziensis TaxID=60191 RepID=A0A224Y5C4_9ACAR
MYDNGQNNVHHRCTIQGLRVLIGKSEVTQQPRHSLEKNTIHANQSASQLWQPKVLNHKLSPNVTTLASLSKAYVAFVKASCGRNGTLHTEGVCSSSAHVHCAKRGVPMYTTLLQALRTPH